MTFAARGVCCIWPHCFWLLAGGHHIAPPAIPTPPFAVNCCHPSVSVYQPSSTAFDDCQIDFICLSWMYTRGIGCRYHRDTAVCGAFLATAGCALSSEEESLRWPVSRRHRYRGADSPPRHCRPPQSPRGVSCSCTHSWPRCADVRLWFHGQHHHDPGRQHHRSHVWGEICLIDAG